MEKSIQKRCRGKIALIVLAVLAVLLAGALLFVGNYLFRFALSVPGAAHGGAAGTDPELYWATVETFLEKYVG